MTASDVMNIGPREQSKRRVLGLVALTIGVGVAFVLIIYDAPRWMRLIIFFPIWLAGLGLMQARERTCIALAARGTCNLDAGETKLFDDDLIKQLRHKARVINRRSLITAAVITLLALVFPQG
ncbi:MAG TPA: hypothetical protein VIF64_16165 [Pyrinomonadaceae bacterium]|jgi:hypothetical protein